MTVVLWVNSLFINASEVTFGKPYYKQGTAVYVLTYICMSCIYTTAYGLEIGFSMNCLCKGRAFNCYVTQSLYKNHLRLHGKVTIAFIE